MALAVGTTPNRPWPAPEPPDLVLPAGMRRVRFPAMGTTISVLLPLDKAHRASAAVRSLFATWEQTFSRFQSRSELSRLNWSAGTAVAVTPLFWDVLTTALEAARTTQGLYDPTLLHHMVALGYDRTFDRLPAQSALPDGTPCRGGGWRGIRLDEHTRRVVLPLGVGLDLGGLAKGMAVDAALARLRGLGLTAALVNAGGDLAVHGLPVAADAWPIAVEGLDESWTVPLQRGAMATSGVARRRWRQGAQRRHHLLDPRTGLPAQSGLWAVSVVAARCVQAEVAAKAAFVLGPERGGAFLRERGLAGLLIHEDGARHVIGAWPAPLGERAS